MNAFVVDGDVVVVTVNIFGFLFVLFRFPILTFISFVVGADVVVVVVVVNTFNFFVSFRFPILTFISFVVGNVVEVLMLNAFDDTCFVVVVIILSFGFSVIFTVVVFGIGVVVVVFLMFAGNDNFVVVLRSFFRVETVAIFLE